MGRAIWPPPSPAIPVSALRTSWPHSSFQHPVSSLQNLIANLELKLHVSPIRINELRFSNRKFLAILRSASRIPSLLEPQGSGFESLIENAGLRSRLSPSRISHVEISDRERMAIYSSTASREGWFPSSLQLLVSSLQNTQHIDLPSTYGLAWRAQEVRLEPRSVPGVRRVLFSVA